MLVKNSLQILGMENYPFSQILTSRTALQVGVLFCILEQWSPLVLMRLACNADNQGGNYIKLYLTTSTQAFCCSCYSYHSCPT